MERTNPKKPIARRVAAILVVVWASYGAFSTPAETAPVPTVRQGVAKAPATVAGQLHRDRASSESRQQFERIVFPAIAFAGKSGKLSDIGVGRCYLVAQKLRQGTNVRVVIQGRRSFPPSKDGDQKLGVRRAEAVKQQLQRFGVAPGRMSTVSYGASPLIHLRGDWARPLARGTEFEIQADKDQGESPESADRALPL